MQGHKDDRSKPSQPKTPARCLKLLQKRLDPSRCKGPQPVGPSNDLKERAMPWLGGQDTGAAVPALEARMIPTAKGAAGRNHARVSPECAAAGSIERGQEGREHDFSAWPPPRTDQAVQRQRLGENEDEDHAHKQLGLLRVGAHARVAHDADGHAGAQASQAAGQACRKVRVPVEEVVGLVRGLVDCGEVGWQAAQHEVGARWAQPMGT